MQSANQPKTDQPLPPPSRTSITETDTGKAHSTGTATRTTETTPPPAKQPGVGVSVGEKLKGAVHVIHGAGEEFRGSILGALDTMRGRDLSQTEAGLISDRGKEEFHKGMEEIKPRHYARNEEREGAKTGAAPAAEARGSQPSALPRRDAAAAAAAGVGQGKGVPRAEEEKQAPPLQRDEAVAGAGPGKDAPQAQERQPDLPPLSRTNGGNEAETKTGATPGEYQTPYGVRDNQSAPGNVAASQAEGQGVGQQTREGAGGPPASEHGPPTTTTAQQEHHQDDAVVMTQGP